MMMTNHQQHHQQQQQHQQFHHYHHHQIHQVHSESQLERRNSDLEQNRSRNTTDRIGSAMDFRNLCQRIDVDSLRAKLPQLKLPKSLPKLRGRKIFRSSKSDEHPAGGAATGSSKNGGQLQQQQQSHLELPGQSQQFINRTPQRISTISSLMYEGEQEEMRANQGQLQPGTGTYRSAGSLDDDYYAPGGSGERASRPISPIKIPAGGADGSPPTGGGGGVRSSITQRLQRGYKSLSELRLKHIFAKQTTVRRDNIEVDRYVEQYERELKSEKLARERRDREIAENYDIKIKTLAGTRQNTFEEDEVEHEQFERGKLNHETDESGMEATPPLPNRRKPGIAATRFAKVRKPPLEMEEQSGELEEDQPQAPPRPSSYKQLLNKLPHLPSLPSLPQLSREKKEEPATKAEENAEEINPSSSSKYGIRQNIKRLRKSIKRPAKLKSKASTAADSDEEEDPVDKPKDQLPRKTSSINLRARLSRFASTEQLQQRWRKSFKGSTKETREPEAHGATEEPSNAGGVLGGLLLGSQLEKTLAKLNDKVHQLKFFQRHSGPNPEISQPKPNTVGHEPVEIDDDGELPETYHRSDSPESGENGRDNEEDSGEDVSAEEAFGQIQRETQDPNRERRKPSVSENKSTHAARQMAKLAEIQAASKSGAAAWSSESLEEMADEDYPRVLIHQEHSDAYESTLIIAVAAGKGSLSPRLPKGSPAAAGAARSSPYPEITISSSLEVVSPAVAVSSNPAKRSPSPEFQTPAGGIKVSASEASIWLPNEQIIAGFREQQASWPAPSLYKPKSIDIFEASAGGSAAFADFDEALRNAPVLRISAGSSIDTSGEEADDSSSRVTRIRVQSPQIGNSRESLMAQEEEDEEDAELVADRNGNEDEEADEDEEEEEDSSERDASERPPSESPPPPPLPQRRPPPKRPATPPPIYDAVPPPLPISKPPNAAPPSPNPAPPASPAVGTAAAAPAAAVAIPPVVSRGVPQRSASMSRPAKPLVKTSSLRLTYNEQVRPGDVGKVNKLISRFEGGRPRICPRRMHSEEYERSGHEDEPEMEEILELQLTEKRIVDSVTPTNRAVVIPQITLNNNNNSNEDQDALLLAQSRAKKKSMELALDRHNSNCSRSEYGSPLSFPSSRRSSTPTNLSSQSSSIANPNPNPNPNQNSVQSLQQQQQQRRSRRSMTRDDDNFYSFDSDEENSYYSISPSGSSRYVVEI
ncbi:serine/arginine repetitive matrix protein 1 [Drosophila ficusphila]|uniref:serine/arginine repetitive matrix protein 1 n=1 Tax=Drosophila ficusphila TaxID=30025 RepID=UPI0007E7E283|nr:serine/arginine repetitive matrix protein 1 [Drosophila ficusphila]